MSAKLIIFACFILIASAGKYSDDDQFRWLEFDRKDLNITFHQSTKYILGEKNATSGFLGRTKTSTFVRLSLHLYDNTRRGSHVAPVTNVTVNGKSVKFYDDLNSTTPINEYNISASQPYLFLDVEVPSALLKLTSFHVQLLSEDGTLQGDVTLYLRKKGAADAVGDSIGNFLEGISEFPIKAAGVLALLSGGGFH